MKKQVPLILGLVVGFIALAEFYLPWYRINDLQETFLQWASILAAAAYVLGGINVMQVNYPRIRRREPDWQFKVALLASALIMGLACVRWHTFAGAEKPGTVAVAALPAEAGEQALLRVKSSNPDAMLKLGDDERRADGAELALAPGKYPVKVYMKATGYAEFSADVELKAGEVARVEANPYQMWGIQGRVGAWIYDHVFAPCNATMFALLAFFIASAAFRAFRARNVEAALLLGAAILILLGRAPIGRSISQYLPEVADWILDIPNNAGRRAIMMGAALGGIATGLRVILGLERSHLGSD